MRAAVTPSERLRSLVDGTVSFTKEVLRALWEGSERSTERREVYLRAEEIEYETTLSTRESIVVAGLEAGLDNGEIARLIGRTGKHVEHIRAKLRQRQRSITDDLSAQETEQELLDDAMG